MRKFVFFVFILSLASGSCNAQIFHNNAPRKAEKSLFGKSPGKTKKIKVREPRVVLKAKRRQEAHDRKLKRDYEKSVKRSQKRAIEIQTPEVKARMKQNKKDFTARDKAKKKKVSKIERKAGKKYR